MQFRYDPWGGEVIVAINGFKSTNSDDDLVDFNSSEEGRNDRRPQPRDLAEFTETKPSDQSDVFWSYYKDRKKGKSAPENQQVLPYAGSDDVISW